MTPVNLQAVGNHLWQSTVFAAAAALLALALRGNRAHVRHWLWLAASLKFLIPFAALVQFGSRIEWRQSPVPAVPIPEAIHQIAQPFVAAAQPVTAAQVPSILPTLAIAVWLAVSLAILCRWCLRWSRIWKSANVAPVLGMHGGIPVKSSTGTMEPGVFGIFRPVLLFPAGIADRLTPAQYNAIVAHEFCHIRRRDNLAAALHMLVEAAFWFHPLVWWVGSRLVEERERACDEEVLRMGSDPEAYAAGILHVCKLYLGSPLACAAGVTGADLRKRVEAIMSNRMLPSLTPARRVMLAAAALVALAAPVAIGMAQGQPASVLRFEVASIKPSGPSGGRGGMEVTPAGSIRLSGITLKGLIAFAYDRNESDIQGGPKWVNSDGFDVVAKPERNTAPSESHGMAGPGMPGWESARLRTQTMLADRFHLVVHKATRPGSLYALVVTKDGPKMQAAKEDDEGQISTMRSRNRIDAKRGTMHMLAALLTNWLGITVVDKTGLPAGYYYKIEYADDADIYSALQDQLGLKLEQQKGAVESLVIDRADRPTAN
jgi:bla regulator protein blaR1